MNRVITITQIDQALDLERQIIESVNVTYTSIRELAHEKSGLAFFHDLKFLQVGRDPLQDRALNFVEQLNQTFTYLASIRSVVYLLHRYPEFTPYTLNIGTQPGYDIVSRDEEIVGEVFAATSPTSNNKINKDALRMSKVEGARHRFVFFYSPTASKRIDSYRVKFPNVNIVQLSEVTCSIESIMSRER